MGKYSVCLLLVSILCICGSLNAQTIIVSGKITDAASKAPLPGASVKAGSKSVLSNDAGAFSIEANQNDILTITHVGYQEVSMRISGNGSLSVEMEKSVAELQQIVMIGTRRPGRIKTETPVPVDVVNVSQNTLPTAKMDLTSVLNYAAPSFNYNKQSGSDGADHVDLATLRGLGPDQTLVLVNGKRRHQTAFVAVFGTRGRGNSGTDLNAIPVSSIDRVEILRDGASAQYGSDAIAGVINLVLKKDTKKFSANAGFSTYYDNKYNTYSDRKSGDYPNQGKFDGNAFTFGANYGLPIGTKGGYINLSADFLTNGKTYRQELKGILPINYVRRADGDASLTSGGGFLNLDAPLGAGKTHFYAFGGYNYKSSDAFAFTRSWLSKPYRFPTKSDGSLNFVPGIMYGSSDGDTVYSPHIQTHISDVSLAAGIRGETGGGWNWDLSNTFGRNDFHFYGDRTFNAGLGAAQTHFDDGGFNFAQNTVNLNFTKEIPTIASGFSLSLGGEYRHEQYKIYKGEQGSYANYDTLKASGSQGYPGYQPGDVVNAGRNVFGFYADAEIDITKQFLLGGAIRMENYSDFGFTSNYKLAARYKLTHNFNIRGSISTGFRAPSLQQINFSNTFTTVQGGTIAEVKIAPNYSAIAKSAGIEELKQEKSLNASLGFSWKPVRNLTVTIDGYLVKVKDRVVLSGQFSAEDSTLDPVFTNTMKQLHVSLAQFFANAVNTTNSGIDIVVDYNKQFANKQGFKALFTANFQKMMIDKINVPAKLNTTEALRANFLSDREQAFILASAPKTKYALNLEYRKDWFTVGARFTRFGKLELLGYGEDGLGINPQVPSDDNPSVYLPDRYNYNGKTITDLYFGLRLCKSATLYAGADNLFNVHPDLGYVPGAAGWAFNNETGGPWDAVQMGGNGMRLFARLAFNF